MDDHELNRLLREWRAPDAPADLRPRRVQRSLLRWLITGRIPVPVPAALAALLLVSLWVALPRSESLPAPDPAPRRTGELARYPLTGRFEGFDAVIVEMNFAPGVSIPEHRHPGFILGYVVDGQMRFGINHEPGRTVPTGGTFFEPSGAIHTTFGNASPDAPVRCVVFLLVPTGSRPSGPA